MDYPDRATTLPLLHIFIVFIGFIVFDARRISASPHGVEKRLEISSGQYRSLPPPTGQRHANLSPADSTVSTIPTLPPSGAVA